MPKTRPQRLIHLARHPYGHKPDMPISGLSSEAVETAVTDLHRERRRRTMTTDEQAEFVIERAAGHQQRIDDEESGRIIYAARTADGYVKVGSTDDLARRMAEHGIPMSDVIATMPGGYRTERAIHRTLKASRVTGLETYAWTSRVTDFVASMSTPSRPK